MSGSRETVFCGVVTHNRRELLVECLDAIAAQTHPVDRVVVVDNASTDGTPDYLRESGIAGRLPVFHLPVERNGGGAEGFHYAVREGVRSSCDWIWLMDDDCAPEPEALASLLASEPASDPGTALVAPVVTMPGGEVLPLNRGWLRRRWFLTPLVGLSPEHWQGAPVEVEHVSLVGPLVRRSAAAGTEPPRRDFFIWWDDLEWVTRLRERGRMWLVPAARIEHREPTPMPSTSFAARLRDYARAADFAKGWKLAYGLRNMIFCGRRGGYLTAPRAVALASVSVVRALLSGRHGLRAARLYAAYARDGWHGRFRNVAPGDWAALASTRRPAARIAERALGYDRDVAGEARPVAAAPAEVGRP